MRRAEFLAKTLIWDFWKKALLSFAKPTKKGIFNFQCKVTKYVHLGTSYL